MILVLLGLLAVGIGVVLMWVAVKVWRARDPTVDSDVEIGDGSVRPSRWLRFLQDQAEVGLAIRCFTTGALLMILGLTFILTA